MEDVRGVHDPTIIEANQQFYLFSTDTQQPPTQGVPIRISKNLSEWHFAGSALKGVPQEAQEWSQAQGLWAPDVVQVGAEFRMYYSASTFGSTTSLIGLATAADPSGPWTDQGAVVKTSSKLADHNAIDANFTLDREGNQWLVYGSFFGGIYLAKINPATGKLLNSEDYGIKIAQRPQTVDGAIEGPFIYYHPETDYFYLFVSFDSLNDSYNIRVSRAREITGPYLDLAGRKMTDFASPPREIGVKLLGSYQFANESPVYGPGHNSILKTTSGELFIVHHYRRRPFSDEFYLGIRKLFWLDNGWPIVAAATIGEGDEIEDINVATGVWEVVTFDYTETLKKSVTQEVKIKQQNDKYYWNEMQIIPYSINQQLYFSGLNHQGVAVFGKKVKEANNEITKRLE
ncbi:arabinan endo-1,5-alpha-L-arabinosidase [Enterococcus sp. HY326]|uniref:arabinan endo-1,5-alpha-L-arabinosidase n=1 Tax=Enterococcus sp. HY326 TaxID=2971265 RepID=UPI002240BDF6|nr:arabinan endo-1,5-alpha-L-arabinosidase [Enterococcus sp. HY326]